MFKYFCLSITETMALFSDYYLLICCQLTPSTTKVTCERINFLNDFSKKNKTTTFHVHDHWLSRRIRNQDPTVIKYSRFSPQAILPDPGDIKCNFRNPQNLQTMIIYSCQPLPEFIYLNKYLIPTKAKSSTAFHEKLN